MLLYRNIKSISILVILFVFNCIEELTLETKDFESVLVLKATITNELKYVSHSNSGYKIVRPECGNCTSFSSHIQPVFWQD